eukprot:1920855-Pyramimonas_sp.AAC.1
MRIHIGTSRFLTVSRGILRNQVEQEKVGVLLPLAWPSVGFPFLSSATSMSMSLLFGWCSTSSFG